MAPGITAQQEAGTETTVFLPSAFRTYLIASVAPQPWQAVCPGYMPEITVDVLDGDVKEEDIEEMINIMAAGKEGTVFINTRGDQ